MLYTSNDVEKNIFTDDITCITLSKSSELLERKSTNLITTLVYSPGTGADNPLGSNSFH